MIEAGAGVVSLAVLGCAAKLPPTQSVAPVDGEVAIALAQAPDLAQPGGVMAVQVEGVKKPILLVRGEGDAFTALLLKCTHLGCTVGWNAEARSFDCPCHGSRFLTSGQVVNGPAGRSLSQFPTRIVGTEVVVNTSV